MKKRLLSMLLCGVLAVSALAFTACGSDAEVAENVTKSANQVADDVEEYVEEETGESVDELVDDVEDTVANASDYANLFTECYAGITDDENTYAYLGFADEMAALMFYNNETNESGSFVGAYTIDDETGAITITDDSLGVTMTFTCEEQDGGYSIDMGDIGTALIGEITPEQFVECMSAISEGSTPQF